ncbi:MULTISPECIES: hypothetical protein [unclassified Flavobacterium]|uniref:hypothetical protein n=1 Tax=unclassified Flavobacterium TaxID=196869 RepID=UPI001F133769|nr:MULTISPECIES: hypothetical protein [unclassified Flavobacterium]UMY66924.1 hypothetical protein MKO97_05965 [Flavobacterium sp. HJ-32-4]
MAHDNFEDLLKRRLEERRLEPSENAWERINARPRRNRSRRRGFVYTAVAASLLLLMGWFWTDRPETTIENRVVTVPAVEPEKPVANTAPVVVSPRVVKEKKEGWAMTTVVPSAVPADTDPHVVSETPSAPAAAATVEERKIQEIVAELDQRQQHGKAITDATVDSLLANAQREIALEKQQRSGTDPTRLLAESEIELNRSFKERVFTAINKFRKVRIAVSSNNP